MIQWTDELHLGHRPLDDHHKRMVEAANQLHRAHRSGVREEVLTRLHSLIATTAEHFLFEEALMEQTNYPKRLIHTEHHGEVLAQLNRFFDRIVADKQGSGEKVVAFLQGWLINHLATFDRDFVEFMSQP